jgi:hypothetical protein
MGWYSGDALNSYSRGACFESRPEQSWLSLLIVFLSLSNKNAVIMPLLRHILPNIFLFFVHFWPYHSSVPFYSPLCSTFYSLTNFYILICPLSFIFCTLLLPLCFFFLLFFLFSLSYLHRFPPCASSSSNSPFVPTSYFSTISPLFSLFTHLEVSICISPIPVAPVRTWAHAQDLPYRGSISVNLF